MSMRLRQNDGRRRLVGLIRSPAQAVDPHERVAAELLRRMDDRETMVVGVTSVEPFDQLGEHAAALARLLAAHLRTPACVVEADLRSSGRLAPATGRAGLLAAQADPQAAGDLLIPLSPEVWLLPADSEEGESASARPFGALLTSLTKQLPTVVVVVPPLDDRGDGDVVADRCDALVILIERDRTSRAALEGAVARIGADRFVGAVMLEPARSRRGRS